MIVFHAMWIPGLLFEDTKGTEKPSQTPENMGYFRDYHKACGRKTGNDLGRLRWCHVHVARTLLSACLYAELYCAAPADSSRRQIDSPGHPVANKPSVAGSGVGASSDTGFCDPNLISFDCSLSPTMSPVTIGLFGMVSYA